MKIIRITSLGLLFVPLGACGLTGAGVVSIPDQPFEQSAIKSLTKKYANAICLKNSKYSECNSSNVGEARPGSWLAKIEECSNIVESDTPDATALAGCKSFRNNMIAELQLAIDYNFNVYTGNLLAGRAKTGFYVGGLRSGLETGATLIAGEGVKTVLSSLAALTGTLQSSANEQFYYEQTGPALIQSMEASRKLVLADILRKQFEDYDKYPIASAVNDLNTYYRSGTIAGAIAKLQKEAVKADLIADAKISCVSKAQDGGAANSCPDVQVISTGAITEPVVDQSQKK